MIQNTTSNETNDELTAAHVAEAFRDMGADAEGFGDDGDGQATVVVQRDGCPLDPVDVEAEAEERGFFVFARDRAEWTLVAFADCEWKTNPNE